MTYQPTSPRIEDTEETYVALSNAHVLKKKVLSLLDRIERDRP